MRLPAIVVAGVVCLSALAHADTAAELREAGEKAAKEGNYANAIDKFKAADRLEPRARHACLIALAYTRRNLWPQAEIFRTKCHERATESDPLPDWMPTADKQIDDAIGSANVAAVTITVEPDDAATGAQLTVSSFAPDEKFPPRVIHLPPGIHQLFASASGYQDGHELVEIKDRTPKTVVIKLHRPGEGPPPEVPGPLPPAPAPNRVPWYVMGTGVGIAAVGGVLHLVWYWPALNKYQDALDKGMIPVPKNIDNPYTLSREVVIGCYIVGGATAVTGLVLKYTVFKNQKEAPTVSFVPAGGGGMVSVGWSR